MKKNSSFELFNLDLQKISFWPVVLILALGWLWLINSPMIIQKDIAWVMAQEAGDSHYPQIAHLVEMIRNNNFSFWNPNQIGGADTLANFNAPLSSVFLFVLLENWLAYGLIYLFVTSVSFLGFYLLCTSKYFSCNPLISLLGACVYTSWYVYGGFVWLYQAGLGFAMLPWLLLWLTSINRFSLMSILISILLGVVFSLGGNFWAWTMFSLGLVAISTLVLKRTIIDYWTIHLILITLIAGGIQYPFLAAILDSIEISGRNYYGSSTKLNLSPIDWLNPSVISWQDVVSGFALSQNPSVPPFTLLAISSILVVWYFRKALPLQSDGSSQVYQAICLGTLFLLFPFLDILVERFITAIIAPLILSEQSVSFSFESRMRHGRVFLSAAAGTIALNLIFKNISNDINIYKKYRKISYKSIGGNITILLVCTIWLKINFTEINSFIKQKIEMTNNGINFAYYYNQPDLKELAHQNPNFDKYRLATIQLYGHDSDFSAFPIRDPSLFGPYQNVYGFETADGYNSNPLLRSMNLMNTVVVDWPDKPRSEYARKYEKKFIHPEQAFAQKLYLYEPIGSKSLSSDGCIRTTTPIMVDEIYKMPLLSLLNVKYIVSGVPLESPQLRLMESKYRTKLKQLQCAPVIEKIKEYKKSGMIGRPLYIYENKNVLPRYFIATDYAFFKNENSLMEYLNKSSNKDLIKKVALINDPTIVEDLKKYPVGLSRKIELVTSNSSDNLMFSLSGKDYAVVVVSSSYSPYWKAVSNDGKQLKVFAAYHALIGIIVPKGVDKFQLFYDPPYKQQFKPFLDFFNKINASNL